VRYAMVRTSGGSVRTLTTLVAIRYAKVCTFTKSVAMRHARIRTSGGSVRTLTTPVAIRYANVRTFTMHVVICQTTAELDELHNSFNTHTQQMSSQMISLTTSFSEHKRQTAEEQA